MKSKIVVMETGCNIKSEIRSTVSTSRAELHLNNDSDVPTLSITAPSEEVSEIEDNLGSSASQTPATEQVGDHVDEAKKVVGDVLTMASEILQSKSQDSSTKTEVEDTSETLVAVDDAEDDELASVTSLAGSKRWSVEIDYSICPEIRDVANDFVKGVIEKACHEANKRIENSNDGHNHGHHTDRFEIADTLSSGDPDKRRPWYRRARSSASKLLHRLCICSRAHSR